MSERIYRISSKTGGGGCRYESYPPNLEENPHLCVEKFVKPNHLEFNPPSMAVPEGIDRVVVFARSPDTGEITILEFEERDPDMGEWYTDWQGWLPADGIEYSVKECGE